MKPSEVKSMAQYESELGVESGSPEGKHVCQVTKVTISRNDEGAPVAVVLARVIEGEYERRIIPIRLAHWVATATGNGEPKTEQRIKQGNSFVRMQTLRFLKAVFGQNYEDAPDYFELIGPDDEPDEAERIMQTWASALNEQYVGVTVKNQKDEDGNLTGWQDQTFQATVPASSFSL